MLGRTPGTITRDPAAQGRRDRRLRRHRGDAAPLHPEGPPEPLRPSPRRRLRPLRRHRGREARGRGGLPLGRRAPGLPDRGADGGRDRRRPAGRRADREHGRRHRRRHQRGRGDLAGRDRRLAVDPGRRRRDGRGDRQPLQARAQAADRPADRRGGQARDRLGLAAAGGATTEIRGRDMVTGLPKTVDARPPRRSAPRSRSRSARSSARSRTRSTAPRPSSPATSWTGASPSPAAARCCRAWSSACARSARCPPAGRVAADLRRRRLRPSRWRSSRRSTGRARTRAGGASATPVDELGQRVPQAGTPPPGGPRAARDRLLRAPVRSPTGRSGPLRHPARRRAVFGPIEEGADRALKPARDLVNWFDETFEARGENDDLEAEVEEARAQAVGGAGGAGRRTSSCASCSSSTRRRRSPLRLQAGDRPRHRPLADRLVLDGDDRRRLERRRRGRRPGDHRRRPRRPGHRDHAAAGAGDADHRPRSAVSAKVVPSGVQGVIEPELGDPEDLLLDFIDTTEDIGEGQTVVTAGWSRQGSLALPARTPIGDVTEARSASRRRSSRSTCGPSPTSRDLDFVQVLTGGPGGRVIVTPRIVARLALIVVVAVILQVSFFSQRRDLRHQPRLLPVVVVARPARRRRDRRGLRLLDRAAARLPAAPDARRLLAGPAHRPATWPAATARASTSTARSSRRCWQGLTLFAASASAPSS